MKMAPVAKVKARFSSYLRACENEPVIVTRHGKSVAVLLPIRDDDELEQIILAYSPQFQSILNTARQQIQEGKGIEHDTFWAEMAQEVDA